MKTKIRSNHSEQGMALVTVLLILTVISIIGLTAMGLAINNMKMSTSNRTYQSSYYIAESGVNYTMDRIHTNVADIYSKSKNEDEFFKNVEIMLNQLNLEPLYTNFEESFGEHPEARISISKMMNGNSNSVSLRDYKMISKGSIGDRSRTVEKPFRIMWKPKTNTILPDTAVFVDQNITLTGGAQIIGKVGTNSSNAHTITLDGGASLSANIYVGPGANPNTIINKPDWMQITNRIIPLTDTKQFEMPPFPDFPTNPIPLDEKVNGHDVIKNGTLNLDWATNNYTLKMTQNLQLKEINLTSNYTLNIDVGNNDRSLVVKNLNIPTGHIHLLGTGKLSLYVEQLSIGSGSTINYTENQSQSAEQLKQQVKKLDFYYKGTTLVLSGAQKISGSLFANNADLTFTGGSGFLGHIVTGGRNVTIDGGANMVSQVFYAPNADVRITGGGVLKGTIVAKNYSSSGGGRTTFEKPDYLPPFIGGTTDEPVEAKDLVSFQPTREQ